MSLPAKMHHAYVTLQYSAEMNTSGDKTPATFHTSYNLRADYWLIKTYLAWFLAIYYVLRTIAHFYVYITKNNSQ